MLLWAHHIGMGAGVTEFLVVETSQQKRYTFIWVNGYCFYTCSRAILLLSEQGSCITI